MNRHKINIIKLLSGILLVLIATALSGCTYSEDISRDLINIPENEAKDISQGKIIVYGVAFEQLNTILTIGKFGIEPSGDGNTVKVSFGLTYSIDYYETKTTISMSELNMIIKQHGFVSLGEFTQKYASAEPMMPGSAFRAVPKDLGQDLFNFALRNVNRSEGPLWNQGR